MEVVGKTTEVVGGAKHPYATNTCMAIVPERTANISTKTMTGLGLMATKTRIRNVVRGNRDVTTRPVFAKNGKQEHVPEEPAALGLMVLKNCGQMLMEMGAVSVKGMMGIGSHKAAAPATNDSGVMAKEGNLWGGRQAVRWGKEDQ
jgi:hypothetical protein|mmetsp:Transcript_58430/g.96965  ORF Transcript_58430/g.96965 Transcript_58430/m.96965 type:complete len:146 (+) Transcript_58430:447-884(+)